MSVEDKLLASFAKYGAFASPKNDLFGNGGMPKMQVFSTPSPQIASVMSFGLPSRTFRVPTLPSALDLVVDWGASVSTQKENEDDR